MSALSDRAAQDLARIGAALDRVAHWTHNAGVIADARDALDDLGEAIAAFLHMPAGHRLRLSLCRPQTQFPGRLIRLRVSFGKPALQGRGPAVSLRLGLGKPVGQSRRAAKLSLGLGSPVSQLSGKPTRLSLGLGSPVIQ